jgi:hypothetical protein
VGWGGHGVQVADSFGLRHQFRHGSDLHFLHHPMAVGFYSPCCSSQLSCVLFIHFAPNDKFENLPFTRGQFPDASANHVQLAAQATRYFMMRYSPLNCPKKHRNLKS